ncbi:hypothetical protein [Streptomyces sp. NPDC002758]
MVSSSGRCGVRSLASPYGALGGSFVVPGPAYLTAKYGPVVDAILGDVSIDVN